MILPIKAKSFLFLLITTFLLTSVTSSAAVRKLGMNDSKMEPIYFSLGRSTVLVFSEKPIKTVVGNKNYFNVEYINNEVTIQPLNNVETNLFVYTEYNVFGFLLKPSNSNRYDDRVKIRWKSNYKSRFKRKKNSVKKEKKLQTFKFNVKNLFKITAHGPRPSPVGKGSLIMDISLVNKSKEKVKTEDIKITLTRRKKLLSEQNIVFASDEIKSEKEVKIRVFLNLKEKKGFTLNVNFKEKSGKVIIPRRFL